MLINLAGNAIKFTDTGEVAITVTPEAETQTNVTIRCSIRDTGIGIPGDRMDRLFESFSQVDASTTRQYGGSGLGLAISKQITELMGGQIGVTSEFGNGSTFSFSAVFEKQPADLQQVPVNLGDIDNARVIVVDDNSTNRKIVSSYLTNWGCLTTEAGCADQALRVMRTAAAEGNPFKIALLDSVMSDVNGESLGRQIKADPQLQDVMLVMLTSSARRGDARRLHEAGFVGYLLKPLKQSQLLDCLRTITGKNEPGIPATNKHFVTSHSIAEDRMHRVRILLAEDNPVNQKVAMRILETKLGFHTDAVVNGAEAVEMLSCKDYDLVLMDCQMAVIDGYEATRIIRDPNSPVRDHYIKIIAMTANVMTGDREKCLEAGMDDYLAKPFRPDELADAIERNLPRVYCSLTPEHGSFGGDHHKPITSQYADDPDFADIIDEFVADLPETISTMHDAMANNDHQHLASLAHQLKGAGGGYGYFCLTEKANSLESAAKAEDIEAASLVLNELRILCKAIQAGHQIHKAASEAES